MGITSTSLVVGDVCGGGAPGVLTFNVALALLCGPTFFLVVGSIVDSSSSSLSNPTISTSPPSVSSCADAALSVDEAVSPDGLNEASLSLVSSSADDASEEEALDEDSFEPLESEPDFFFLSLIVLASDFLLFTACLLLLPSAVDLAVLSFLIFSSSLLDSAELEFTVDVGEEDLESIESDLESDREEDHE